MKKLLLAAILTLIASSAVAQNQFVVPPSIGAAPVVSGAAESSHVLKAVPGNLYGLYVTTGATAGYVMTFNAAAAPADGAVTPVDCVYVPATSSTALSWAPQPPEFFSTGIVVVFSSTGCFSKTASATAFFHAMVQ